MAWPIVCAYLSAKTNSGGKRNVFVSVTIPVGRADLMIAVVLGKVISEKVNTIDMILDCPYYCYYSSTSLNSSTGGFNLYSLRAP